MGIFDLEEERVKQEIIKLGAKRVLIQFPQGLKNECMRIAKVVKKAGALPIVSADSCYGACDLATSEAEILGADLIVHYGHAKLLKYEKVPTIYIEARATLNVNELVNNALPLMDKWHKIGLVTTVQHVHVLDEVKEILVRAGKTVMVGDAGRMNYPGQVIGCDYSNAKSIAGDVEAFLFIGGGRFHPLGLALSVLNPTIVVDPYENRAYDFSSERDKILKKRWASVQEAEKAKTFAVLVGLKPGQKHMDEALTICEKLRKHGKEVCVFAVRELTPEVILDFTTVEAYVNTLCPRVSLDDASRFRKPMLTINEARVILGELSWEELYQSGWFGD